MLSTVPNGSSTTVWQLIVIASLLVRLVFEILSAVGANRPPPASKVSELDQSPEPARTTSSIALSAPPPAPPPRRLDDAPPPLAVAPPPPAAERPPEEALALLEDLLEDRLEDLLEDRPALLEDRPALLEDRPALLEDRLELLEVQLELLEELLEQRPRPPLLLPPEVKLAARPIPSTPLLFLLPSEWLSLPSSMSCSK